MARRVLHDAYFKLAKSEGYLARSAYKLKQMQAAKRLLASGDVVLDLGCAPGSWLQVAAEIVGPQGLVVGLDLQEVRAAMPENVHALQGDLREADAERLRAPAGGRAFDVVLSDMAPSTSGYGDAERSAHLCRDVLAVLPAVLRPGGSLAMKVLEGAEYAALLEETRALFDDDVRGYKPPASRDVSREMYVVARGFRPPAEAPKQTGRRLPPHLRWPDGPPDVP